MALASISIDLDSLHHYCRIHALDEALLDARGRRLVYQVAIDRFSELLARTGAKATFFAIGEDVEDTVAASALKALHAAGSEVGNHSYRHDYGLARLEEDAIAAEVSRGAEAIRGAVGEAPVGFRAPGYTLSAALYRILVRQGYRYDSSAFPAIPYYAAKALVMGALALGRKSSGAVLDSPRVLGAPPHPYAPDPSRPYRRGTGPVLELPISTVPFLRVPFIGTFATVFPQSVVHAAYRALRSTPHFNFELHGIDLLDAGDGIPPELVRRQRDLGIPWERKRARLEAVFRWLRDDFEVVPLSTAAERLSV